MDETPQSAPLSEPAVVDRPVDALLDCTGAPIDAYLMPRGDTHEPDPAPDATLHLDDTSVVRVERAADFRTGPLAPMLARSGCIIDRNAILAAVEEGRTWAEIIDQGLAPSSRYIGALMRDAEFARRFDAARQVAACRAVLLAQQAAQKADRTNTPACTLRWKHFMTVAARLDPKTWGERTTHEVGGPGGGAIPLGVVRVIESPKRRELRAAADDDADEDDDEGDVTDAPEEQSPA